MKITSAKFVRGAVGTDEIFEDGMPQIAFIGRSNVGKSSVINSLVHQPGLARTSSFPGRTQEINIFLINKSCYFIDLPGYGFSKGSHEAQARLLKLIFWYLFESGYVQKKVVLIVDANVGPTDVDLKVLRGLEEQRKNIIIVANKVDKIKTSQYTRQLQKIRDTLGNHKIIPYSLENKTGFSELRKEVL